MQRSPWRQRIKSKIFILREYQVLKFHLNFGKKRETWVRLVQEARQELARPGAKVNADRLAIPEWPGFVAHKVCLIMSILKMLIGFKKIVSKVHPVIPVFARCAMRSTWRPCSCCYHRVRDKQKDQPNE